MQRSQYSGFGVFRNLRDHLPHVHSGEEYFGKDVFSRNYKGKTLLDAFGGRVGKLLNLEYAELKKLYYIKDIEERTGKPLTTHELAILKNILEEAFKYRVDLWNIQEKEKTALKGGEEERRLVQAVKEVMAKSFKCSFDAIINSLKFDKKPDAKAALIASAIFSLMDLNPNESSKRRYAEASERITSGDTAIPVNDSEKIINLFKFVATKYMNREDNFEDIVKHEVMQMTIENKTKNIIINGFAQAMQSEKNVGILGSILRQALPSLRSIYLC